MNPVALTFLGASGPYPGSDDLPSILVSSGRRNFLVDAGEGVQHRLLTAGKSVSSITYVLISHLHGDHVLGLLPFIQSRSLSGAESPLTIIGPAGLKAFLLNSFAHLMFTPSYEVKVVEVKSRGVVNVEGARVSYVSLKHSIPTVGYRLDVGGVSLCYVTDTRPCEEEVNLCRGADVLIHDSAFSCGDKDLAEEYGHSTVCEAAEAALKAGVKALYLYHVSPRYKGSFDALIAQCRKTFMNCFMARKFMKIYLMPKLFRDL